MLQRFKVRNYRNFRDELIFSFKTLKDYEFNKELIKDGIIKDCLVVGKNASGKTNLGYAIFDPKSRIISTQNIKTVERPVCQETVGLAR